ncbi:DoxX family protein [Nesterenkonia sp. HG001]|uniref:DoxX family protein n=1 Tax=Nesterenkonia sp. HG001 TaxID=2983207 RepID=UPI002AC3E38F|nr:DoxX family protein [Nesterenkonia sp. HG001]MDZ5079157.1 DoxX family protein [Nesterenkonia sp. HG001]
MEIVLWLVTGFLALGFLAGGLALMVLPRERYRALGRNQHWVDMLDDATLKALGALKMLAGLGLVLPAVLGIAEWLVPTAALGLMMYMTGATAVRTVRREWGYAVADVAFILMAGIVAWGRTFGPGTYLAS